MFASDLPIAYDCVMHDKPWIRRHERGGRRGSRSRARRLCPRLPFAVVDRGRRRTAALMLQGTGSDVGKSEIGRAHVGTTGTNEQLGCRLPADKEKQVSKLTSNKE